VLRTSQDPGSPARTGPLASPRLIRSTHSLKGDSYHLRGKDLDARLATKAAEIANR
jgi:hypothetical protein